ncbi:hypothetical protein RZS08_64975, partial [Arthrospira platensis SPKY1]|nr:hypothetical protein [Arthrospira platensis SPKY1]
HPYGTPGHDPGEAHCILPIVAAPVEQASRAGRVQPFLRTRCAPLGARVDQDDIQEFQPPGRRIVFRHQGGRGAGIGAGKHPDPIGLAGRQPEPGRIADRRDQN